MSSDMSDELEFAALHADDLLLDALGARRPVEASGGSTDAVAGLLLAYAHEIDHRPGPLTGLLGAGTAEYVPVPQPVPAKVPAPPVDEPAAIAGQGRNNRARFLVAHRAAAVVTVGSLVLGLGGVSAAVTGEGGPLDGIRRVVDSVTEQVTPHRSPDAARISRTLSDAEAALAAADLRSARELLEKARTDIEGASDPAKFSSLRSNLIELRDRWHRALDEDATPQSAPTAQAGTAERFDPNVPGEGMLGRDRKPGNLVGGQGGTAPAERLPVAPEPEISETKDQLAGRAEQKLEPLPDLPVDEIRQPTWAPITGEGGLLGGK